MQTFVINLARRPDRMSAMTAQLDALRIPFTRIDAVDARDEFVPGIGTRIAPAGPLGPMARGDACCSLSHIRVWETFVSTPGDRYALVLEDDVTLYRDGPALLAQFSNLPADVDLLKLECYGNASRRILVGTQTPTSPEFQIAPLHSKHTGSGAYLISRTLAARLLQDDRPWPFSIDQMLFNLDISPIAGVCRPYQLLPAVAAQTNLKTDSDIESWRVPFRALNRVYLARELRRAGISLGVLPRQILAVLSGQSHFVRVDLASN